MAERVAGRKGVQRAQEPVREEGWMRLCSGTRYVAKGTRAALSAVMFPDRTLAVQFSIAALRRSNRIGSGDEESGVGRALVGSSVATVTGSGAGVAAAVTAGIGTTAGGCAGAAGAGAAVSPLHAARSILVLEPRCALAGLSVSPLGARDRALPLVTLAVLKRAPNLEVNQGRRSAPASQTRRGESRHRVDPIGGCQGVEGDAKRGEVNQGIASIASRSLRIPSRIALSSRAA